MTYPLDADKVVIGRSRSCDIRLREDTVSRLHAALLWQEGELILEDLGSSNGTYLNGIRVLEPQTVASGDVLRFGALRGTVEHGAARPRSAARTAAADAELDFGAPAGFGWRLLAVVADTVVFALGSAVPFAPLLATLAFERFLLAPDSLPTSPQVKLIMAGACGVLWLVYAFLYFVHGWARRGGSLGMKLLRLRLLDWRRRSPIGYSRALLRCAAGLVTILTFGVGFLVAAFRRDRKTLHDVLAGTLVCRRPRPLGRPAGTA